MSLAYDHGVRDKLAGVSEPWIEYIPGSKSYKDYATAFLNTLRPEQKELFIPKGELYVGF